MADDLRVELRARIGASWLISITLLALIVGSLGYYTFQRANGNATAATFTQISPPHARYENGTPTSIWVPPTGADNVATDIPRVSVFIDYLDATSAGVVTALSDALNALSARNEIVLEYRTMTFNDRGRSDGPSGRAAVAAACADIQDVFAAYHSQIISNQNSDGFTDEQLRSEFARNAGLKGEALITMQRCYDLRLTEVFVQEVAAQATRYLSTQNTRATPAFFVNDTPLNWRDLITTAGRVTEKTLRDAINSLVEGK